MATFRLRSGREINTNPKCKYWYFLANKGEVPSNWRDNPSIKITEEELILLLHWVSKVDWSKINRKFINDNKIMYGKSHKIL